MEDLNDLVQQYISEKCGETMKAVADNEEHQKDVGEMNRLFDAEITAQHAARRYAYLYMGKLMEGYFEKGFYAGMAFAAERIGDSHD